MSYRGGGLPYGGRAPVSYDDVDSSRDSRPTPPGDRNGYGGGGRGGYDRDYRGGGRGYDRDYERDRGGGYRGGGGYERRRSRSPVRRDGDGGRGGRPRAYDYDDDYSRRDRGGYRSRSPPPPRSGRRHTRSPSRSRSPPRRRRDSRSPSRTRSPRSRSPPPAPRDRRRDDDGDERKEKRGGKGKEPGVVTADDAAEVDEQDIAALMGFGGFGTTQVRQDSVVFFFVKSRTLITLSCRARRTRTTSPPSASGRNGTIANT
ncbi:hypothetical protein AAT19DRAFT_13184 [Rhodotorula toruloides]|uniref:Uncharacterized protein n=1 Tax=Rhodotorula toruloides TaxID=5286 RepID=A0A2T0ADU0_RHOTO|nr:hypothetical protein AAT19DRAFT_13184 [Rhodotorula toruloides]